MASLPRSLLGTDAAARSLEYFPYRCSASFRAFFAPKMGIGRMPDRPAHLCVASNILAGTPFSAALHLHGKCF